jgi:hypothetical protein
MPDNSTSANTACAGATRSAWRTGWTAFTEHSRAIQQRMRRLIWRYYEALKDYQSNPGAKRRAALRARFDRIFRRRTGFATLDRLLARLHANKAELLMVLVLRV